MKRSCALLPTLENASREVGFAELARRTGIDRSYLYTVFDRKEGNPSLGTLEKIAEALGYVITVEKMDLALKRTPGS